VRGGQWRLLEAEPPNRGCDADHLISSAGRAMAGGCWSRSTTQRRRARSRATAVGRRGGKAWQELLTKGAVSPNADCDAGLAGQSAAWERWCGGASWDSYQPVRS